MSRKFREVFIKMCSKNGENSTPRPIFLPFFKAVRSSRVARCAEKVETVMEK